VVLWKVRDQDSSEDEEAEEKVKIGRVQETGALGLNGWE